MNIDYPENALLPIDGAEFEAPPADGNQAIQRLAAGNHQFSEWVADATSGSEFDRAQFEMKTGLVDRETIAEQAPYAVVVGCSDASYPLHLALGQPTNSLFEICVAGNVLGEACVGSIDFALQNLPSVKAIIVLGHTHCGSVTAAVDCFIDPMRLTAPNMTDGIRSIVERLMGSVSQSASVLRDTTSPRGMQAHRDELIETAIYVHAATEAADLYRRLSNAERRDIRVAYGAIDLHDYVVRSPHGIGGSVPTLQPGLALAPHDMHTLEDVAVATAKATQCR